MPLVKVPVLGFSWPEDKHFPLDSQAATYRAAPGPHQVTLIPGLRHGHGPPWLAPDSYAFAESIVQTGQPWCVQERAGIEHGAASAVFISTRPLERALLVSTADSGITGERKWIESPAIISRSADRWMVTAPLPAGTTAWFINVHCGNLTASSDFQEIQ